MKVYNNVRATSKYIPSIEVNVDTVYIRSNIIKVDEEEFKGWEYDEMQYTIREWQELVGTKTDLLQEDVNDVAELTTIVAMDKDDLAEMLVYALQKIDELEGRLNG